MDRDRSLVRAVALALPLLACCATDRQKRGRWPPDDFRLEIQYTVVTDGKGQVRRSARFFADGLVVYREADDSLRTRDGAVVLPVFRRVCAYRMHWRSVRLLARDLHRAPVLELRRPLAVTLPQRRESHIVRFQLTYMANQVDFVAHDQAAGLANRVLRIVNGYLPPDHAIELPQFAGQPEDYRLLDVPPFEDSLEGALGYHREWLMAHADDPGILRDTFSLACRTGRWSVAEECLSRIAKAVPSDMPAMREILATSRAQPQKGG